MNSSRAAIPQFSLPQLAAWNALQDAQATDCTLSTVEPGRPLQRFPFRTAFYGIGLCRQGSVDLHANLACYHIRPDSLLLMEPGVIRQWQNQTADYQAIALFFTEKFFLENNVTTTLLRSFPFFEAAAPKALELLPEEAATVWHLLEAIGRALAGTSPRKYAIVRGYTYSLLNLTADYYERCLRPAAMAPARPPELVSRFQQLVGTQYLHLRAVAAYADLLCVTAKHLSETVKAETGKTAGEWITERVLLEAQVRLRQTPCSIAQLASALRFSDASAFGKFFRRHAGLSPAGYRRQPLR